MSISVEAVVNRGELLDLRQLPLSELKQLYNDTYRQYEAAVGQTFVRLTLWSKLDKIRRLIRKQDSNF